MQTRSPSSALSWHELEPLSFDTLPGVTPVARRLAAGGALFRQGDAGIGIFRLVSGRLRLLRCTRDGTEVAMHTVRPGELFAEASLFSTHYHCDAIALEDSAVLLYPKEDLARQLAASPQTLLAFTAELAHRLQGLRSRLEIRQIRSARERVMQFLQLHCDNAGMWARDGTLKQLAEELGLTHEVLYRSLARLEDEGHITRLPTGIRLQLRPITNASGL